MSPSMNASNAYVDKLKDALLDNSALRDGLTDEEAKPLIDWALRQADYVAASIENDEDAEFKQTNLNRLVLYITRFTTRRLDGKDDEWVTKQLSRLNEFSTNIGGKTLPDSVQAQLLHHAELSHEDVLGILTSAFDQAEMPTQPMPTAQPDVPTDTALDIAEIAAGQPDETQQITKDVQANLSSMQEQSTEPQANFLNSLSSAIKKHLTDIEDDETL